MASIEHNFGEGFRGKMDGLSFYKMKGVEKTVVRRSAGHSKAKQKRDPKLELFRRQGSEFGGRSKAGKFIRGALRIHKPGIDHNIAGPLTRLLQPVQALDTTGDLGHRSILISQHRHFLKGFSLTRKHPFDSVITSPVSCVIDRNNLSAKVQLPALMPQINFMPPVNFPFYNFMVGLSAVPDVVYKLNQYAPTHYSYREGADCDASTGWFPLLQGSPAMELNLKSDVIPPDEHFTLMLSISIRYGILRTVDLVEMVPYGGSAKILEVA